MNLAGFNRLSDAQAGALLADCCAARRWVAGMLAERPFTDSRRLERAARSIWADMGEDDWLEAFSAHPRIGDLDSLRERFASTRALAGSEQSGMQATDEATLAELARLNVGYEARFGFIFIVFASGKSAARMLELLRSRIDNTRDQELRNAAAEQLKITLLRLEKLISGNRIADSPPSPPAKRRAPSMSQITTHILDTARGCPAEGVRVVFHRVDGERFVELAHGVTDDNGRVSDLLDADLVLDQGTYRMVFEVSGYFRNRGHKHFYPYVDVVFNVEGDGQHYHIPLLLSPYGYSTYRGS